MDLKENVLKRLIEGEASGEQLAMKFGVTRAAIWKCVRAIKADGYTVTAVPGRGYALDAGNILSAERIAALLKSRWTVEALKETTSTNDVAKKRAALGAENYAVFADRQSAGRGRLGRGFSSPSGSGLYMSAVIRPKLSMSDCGKITACVAVIAAQAVEKLCGERVDIKWVNDLYMNGKKICGILTEGGMGLEGGALEYAVVGIGINVLASDFPPEVANVATSVEKESGVKIDRCALAALILDGLTLLPNEIRLGGFLKEYRDRSCVIGKEVTVNNEFAATVKAIDDDCALILERDGKKLKFSAGEISLKINR